MEGFVRCWAQPGMVPGLGGSEQPSVLTQRACSLAGNGDGPPGLPWSGDSQRLARLPGCWCEMWEVEARPAGATPAAAGPQQAASYVQFVTEEEFRGSAEGLPLPWGSRAGTVHVRGGEAYKGPLNWFPDRCCRMEGLELAASPSFLQTTCAERRGET